MKDSLLLLGCIAFILVDNSLAVRRMRRSAPAVLQNPAQISKDFVQLQTNTNQDNNNSEKSDGMDGNLQMNSNNDDQMSNLNQNKNNCAPRDTEMGVSGGGSGNGGGNGGNSNLEPGLQDSNNQLLNILNLKNKKDTFNSKFPKQNDLNNQQQQPQQQQQQQQMQEQMAVNGNNNIVAAQSPQVVGSGESDVNELKQPDVCMAAENGNGNGGAQLMNSQALEGEMSADESEMPSKDFDTANVRDGHPRILLHNLKNSKLAKLTNKGGSGSGAGSGGSNNYKNLLTQARVNHNNNNNNNGNRNNFTPNLKNNNGNKVTSGNNNNNAGFTNNNNNNNNNDNGAFNNNNDNSNNNNGNRNNNNNFNSNEGRPNSPNNNNNNNNKNNNDNNNNNNMASNSNANNNAKNNAGNKMNSAVNSNKVVGNNNNKNNNNARVNDADRNNNNNNDNNDNIDFNNLGRNGNAGTNSQFNKNNNNNKINNNDNNSGAGSKSSNSDYNNNNNNAGSGSGSAGKNLLTNDNLNYIIKGATNKNMIVNKNNAGQNNKANRIVTNLENANRQSDYISDMKNLIFNDSFISYPVKVIYGNGMESSPKLEEHDNNNDLLLKQQPLKNFALSGNSNSLNSLSNFNSLNNLNADLSNPLSNLNQMNNNNNKNMHSNNVKFSSGIKKMEEDMDLKTPVVPQRAPWQGPGGEQLMPQSQPVRKDKFSPVESVLKFANMLLYKVGLSDNKSYRPSATQVYVNPGTNPGSPGSISDNDDFDSIDYLYNSLGDNSASGTTRSAVISPSGSISVPLMPPFVFQPPMTQTDAATLPFNFLENALDSLLSTSANAEDDSGDDDFELRCPVHRESNKEKRNSSAANPNDVFQVCSCRLYKKKRSPKE